MKILFFKLFESYLLSGRHLLYHTTRLSFLEKIISSDSLLTRMPSRGPQGVCFSRNISWTDDGNYECRIVLDSDKLIRSGYKTYPLQEIAYMRKGDKTISTSLKDRNVWKGNLDWIKGGKRMPPHGIKSLPKERIMEVEFEERILKDIKNLGKYIVYIDISDNIKEYQLLQLKKYLETYSHIKIRVIKDKNRPFLNKEISLKDVKDIEKSISLIQNH